MVLTADGSRVFELRGYGERMELFGLTEEEARTVLDMVPFSARVARTAEAAGDR
jgi:phage-related minor tail protein